MRLRMAEKANGSEHVRQGDGGGIVRSKPDEGGTVYSGRGLMKSGGIGRTQYSSDAQAGRCVVGAFWEKYRGWG